MKDSRIIAIAGAGIAGLCAALFLERQGFRVLVFEASEAPRGVGAGIQVTPNAYKLLENLGLDRPLRMVASAPESIDIYNGINGKAIAQFSLGSEFSRRHGAPYLVLHRVDLANVLLTACRDREDIELIYGHKINDLAAHANGVTLLTQHKDRFIEHHAAAVIGADGVWSSLRGFVHGAAKPEFTGHIAWRTLLDMEIAPQILPRDVTGLWLGRQTHFVHYPIRQSQVMNIVAITPAANRQVPPRGWIKDGLEPKRVKSFEDWAPDFQTMLLKLGRWDGGWPIYGVKKLGNVANGPLCLIGDAAHAMEPYAAQGGACAIEDAAVLAELCGAHPNSPETAFQKYQKARRKRVQKVINLSSNNRRIYHLGSPFSHARDFVMKHLPQDRLQKRMDWLYGWELDER